MVLSGKQKTARLKDGTEVTLRELTSEHLDALHKFFCEAVPEEDRLFLKHNVVDRKVLEGWVEGRTNQAVRRVLMFHGDEVIADGAIEHHAHGWSSHVAEVRLVVARAYHGKGAGLLLLKELVQDAQTRGVELMKAQVFENSPNGLAVFQKLGFRMEAVLHGLAKDIKGNRQNLVVLLRDVDELWRDMEDLLWQGDWRGDS